MEMVHRTEVEPGVGFALITMVVTVHSGRDVNSIIDVLSVTNSVTVALLAGKPLQHQQKSQLVIVLK